MTTFGCLLLILIRIFLNFKCLLLFLILNIYLRLLRFYLLVKRKQNTHYLPLKGVEIREVFFALVQCNMLHPTNTRKKVRAPWFLFSFHGTKIEGNTQKTRWFCPGTMEQDWFKSILLHCPGDKNERNFVPRQKNSVFLPCRQLNSIFLKGDSYFESKITPRKLKR